MATSAGSPNTYLCFLNMSPVLVAIRPSARFAAMKSCLPAGDNSTATSIVAGCRVALFPTFIVIAGSASDSTRSSHSADLRYVPHLHTRSPCRRRFVATTSATPAQPSESSQYSRYCVVIIRDKRTYKVQAAIQDTPISHMAPVVPTMWTASTCWLGSIASSTGCRGLTSSVSPHLTINSVRSKSVAVTVVS